MFSIGVVVTLAVLFAKVMSDEESDLKCYDELGCFSMEDPWFSLLRPFPPPQTPSEIDTKIHCFSRESDEGYNMTLWPSVSMNDFPFSASRRTVFITHGFLSSANESWVDDLKDAYLGAMDSNVCTVDWALGADTINYLQVASNTRIVGAELARFIRFLETEYGLEGSNLHLIGHSLGAHVCAYAANNVTGVVSRITGLDVAQPGFEDYDVMVRLDDTDAEFVDAIHTNSAPFFPSRGLGSVDPLGHVDFYMNNGRRQPGCLLVNIISSGLNLLSGLSDLASMAASSLVEWSGCSHGKAFHYFTASLRPNCSVWGLASTMKTIKFFSVTKMSITEEECTPETCVPLGLHTPDFPGRGVFTVNTPQEEPFCLSAAENNLIVERLLSYSDSLTESLVETIRSFLRDE